MKFFLINALHLFDIHGEIDYTLPRCLFNFIKLLVYFCESFIKNVEKFINTKQLHGGIMELGTKLRDMRQRKNLTQEELADRCELTKGYISQLENDLTSPSIATLCDLLNALGSNLSDFFHEEAEEKIVFTNAEYIDKQSDGMLFSWVIPNAQKNMMEPVLVELESGASSPVDFPHEGEEFGYVLEGRIAIVRADKSTVAKKGESFYFTANKEHYIVNKGKGKAKFLWISTPPNF